MSNKKLHKNITTNQHTHRLVIESLESRTMLSVSSLTMPIISEIGADNDSTILDGDGNASDWIEIYNPTDLDVDLSGWHLTDKPKKIKDSTWAFPEGTTIEAGGYLLVFTGSDVTHYDDSGNVSVYDSAGYLHADFGLSASGESVALFDNNLSLVHSVQFDTQYEDMSYGVVQTVSTLLNTTQTSSSFEMTAENIANIEALRLTIQSGSSITVSLNGTQIINQSTGVTVVTEINISSYRSLLQEGTNSLEIQTDNTFNVTLSTISTETQSITTGDVQAVEPVLKYQQNPSPGTVNQSQTYDSVCNKVTFSLEHGWYSGQQTIYLSNGDSSNLIYYTTDGSVPSQTNGILYDSSKGITINSTTVLRAIAVKEGSLDSWLSSSTYFFLSDIVNQGWSNLPSGFPTGDVNEQKIDYGMDSDVLSQYSTEQILAAFNSIASFSMVTDADNLFDSSSGIYANPWNSGRDWEREASLELIYPTTVRDFWSQVKSGTKTREDFITNLGGLYLDLQNMLKADVSDEIIDSYLAGFSTECGIRIRGASSRNPENPKHSLHVYMRSEYGGSDSLEYPLFGTEAWNGLKTVTSFEKFDLRTEQQYSWNYNDGSEPAHNTFVRDTLIRAIEGMLDDPTTSTRYYHLFIDGVYWGVYETQERSSSEYAESYFGEDKDQYDIIRCSTPYYNTEVSEGSGDLYNQLWQTNKNYFCPYNSSRVTNQNEVNNAYYKLQGLESDGVTENPNYTKLLDVENLCDYMILTYFFESLDGAGTYFTKTTNNFVAIINRENPEGFQFLTHDNEHSMGLNRRFTTTDTMCNKTYMSYTKVLSSLLYSSEYFNPHYLHECLIASVPDYRIAFADRLYELTHNNGVLAEHNVKNIFSQIQGMMGTAMLCESARWGDATRSTPYTINDWYSACSKAYNWLSGRVDKMTSELQKLYLRIPGYSSTVSNLSKIKFYPSFNPAYFNSGLTYSTSSQSFVYPTSTNGAGLNVLLLTDSSQRLINTSTIPSGTTLYYTTDGSDPRTACSASISSAANPYNAGNTEYAILDQAQETGETEMTVNIRAYNSSTGEWSAMNSAIVYTSDPAIIKTPIPNVVINEAMVNPTTLYAHDYVELYNNESTDIDLSGWILIDSDIEDLANSTKTYWIPDGTTISAGGILFFEEEKDFVFGLGKKGEAVYLLMPDEYGTYTDSNGKTYTLVNTIDIPASEADTAYGRLVDGTDELQFLNNPTPGKSNQYIKPPIPKVVINEAMSNPDTKYTRDFVELYNKEATSIDVGGWILIDSDITELSTTDKAFYIPENTTIDSGGFLLFEEKTDFLFGIGKKGEAVYLLMPDEDGKYIDSNGKTFSLVDTIDIPASEADVSYGRTTDGGDDLSFLKKPTPGITNVIPKEEYVYQLSQNLQLNQDDSGIWSVTIQSADALSFNEWNTYQLDFLLGLNADILGDLVINSLTFQLTYYSNVFEPTLIPGTDSSIVMSIQETQVDLESGKTTIKIAVNLETGYSLSSESILNLGSVKFAPNSDLKKGLQINESLPNLGNVTNLSVTYTLNSESKTVTTSESTTINSTVCSVPYDLDDDGLINSDDFISFATVYGYKTDADSLAKISEEALRGIVQAADFNHDGKVNSDDFILFATNYGIKRKYGSELNIPIPETKSSSNNIQENDTQITLMGAKIDVIDNQDLSDSIDVIAQQQAKTTPTPEKTQNVDVALISRQKAFTSQYDRLPLWKRYDSENNM